MSQLPRQSQGAGRSCGVGRGGPIRPGEPDTPPPLGSRVAANVAVNNLGKLLKDTSDSAMSKIRKEEDDIEKALEESKKTAAEEEQRRFLEEIVDQADHASVIMAKLKVESPPAKKPMAQKYGLFPDVSEDEDDDDDKKLKKNQHRFRSSAAPATSKTSMYSRNNRGQAAGAKPKDGPSASSATRAKPNANAGPKPSFAQAAAKSISSTKLGDKFDEMTIGESTASSPTAVFGSLDEAAATVDKEAGDVSMKPKGKIPGMCRNPFTNELEPIPNMVPLPPVPMKLCVDKLRAPSPQDRRFQFDETGRERSFMEKVRAFTTWQDEQCRREAEEIKKQGRPTDPPKYVTYQQGEVLGSKLQSLSDGSDACKWFDQSFGGKFTKEERERCRVYAYHKKIQEAAAMAEQEDTIKHSQ